MECQEKGSATVIALIILVLLLLLGMSVATTSTIEVQIAGNEKFYKAAFYTAEGAMMHAAQLLEDENNVNTLRNRTPVWLNNSPVGFMRDPDNWDHDGAGGDDNAVGSSLDPGAVFTVVDRGVAPGSSLAMAGSVPTNLHEFAVLGKCSKSGANALIEMGYRKRY